jgi:adenine deaminase
MKLDELISVARGDSPAELVLHQAMVLNVFNGEIEAADIALFGGMVAGIGSYRNARATIDLQGRIVVPGLINGHTHIESSMLDIDQYALAVVPHGTLGVVTDLHEIANVGGIEGLQYMLGAGRRLPLEIYLMAPSCVPATHLETSGAELDSGKLTKIKRWPNVIGLGEMMNYPGVLFRDHSVLSKLALFEKSVIDGHAPGLSGCDLNAYVAAGISSDHESVRLDEAAEKLRRGMYLMIREGSTEKNLETLLPLVTDETFHRCLLVVDDRSAADLLHDGDIDAVVRKAIRLGLNPVRAVQMSTINVALRFGLKRVGAVAPGYHANFIVLDDLENFAVDMVFHDGHLVARKGEALFKPPAFKGNCPIDTVNVKPFKTKELSLTAKRDTFPIIEVIPGQIVTRKIVEKVTSDANGFICTDVGRDLLKIVVVERHRATGNIGRGLVRGFGLKSGAIASSVAHDSHNIIAVGVDDGGIETAVRSVIKMHGGLVAVENGKVIASLALPIAGLLSDKPLEDVVFLLERLENALKSLGSKLPAAFAALSFLALPVIPELRLTDLGLVDVAEFKLIDT